MNTDEQLRVLVDAERSVAPPRRAAEIGWHRLTETMSLGTPAMTVPVSIQLTSMSLFMEGAAIAVAVGAMGTVAIVASAPTRPPVEPHSTKAPTTLVATQAKTAPVQSSTPAPASAAPSSTKPVATVARSAVANGGGNANGATARGSNLEEELALISRASQEIDAGQFHLARVWIDEHRSRFPTGVLGAERDGLEVLMSCMHRQSSDNLTQALEYARKYPGSPLLDRIQRVCKKNVPSTILK